MITDTVGAGQFCQEIPPGFSTWNGRVFELLPSPKDGPFSAATESFGIKQCAVVVIPQQHQIEFSARVDALAWVRAVSNDISQAKNFVDAVRLDIVKHRSEGFDVAVNITDDGAFGQRSGSRRLEKQPRVQYTAAAAYLKAGLLRMPHAAIGIDGLAGRQLPGRRFNSAV